MKRDLMLNFGSLDTILERIAVYITALEEIEDAAERFQIQLEEQESEAISSLLEKRREFRDDLEAIQELLESVHRLLENYIGDMTGYISPNFRVSMMRVDRNDIWWNLNQISSNIGALDWITLDTTGSEHSTFLSWNSRYDQGMTEEQEEDSRLQYLEECQEKENRETNYQIIEGFRRGSAAYASRNMQYAYEEMERIYTDYVKPFENTDDEYNSEGTTVYDKCTSTWERAVDAFMEINAFQHTIRMGAFHAAKDLVAGVVGTAYNIGKLEVVLRLYGISQITGTTPEWVENYLTDTKDMALQVVKNPGRILAGLGQGITDKVDQEGIAYGISYVLTDIAIEILLTKGMKAVSKADDLGNGAKVIDKVEDVEDIAKGASGAKVTNSIETQTSVNKKLETYLLDKSHPVGGSKANWFDEALGFNKSNMGDLSKQIVFDPKVATQTAITEYGTKFNQVIKITGANGKVIDVTFAWIENKDGIVRLVTAIPTKK